MDYQRLGLGDASSLVRDFRIADWGTTLIVDCTYDPLGEQTKYQLTFLECSQLRIDALPNAPVDEEEAEMIGLTLGECDYRQPAVLTTDLFEMHVSYGRFQCVKANCNQNESVDVEAFAPA